MPVAHGALQGCWCHVYHPISGRNAHHEAARSVFPLADQAPYQRLGRDSDCSSRRPAAGHLAARRIFQGKVCGVPASGEPGPPRAAPIDEGRSGWRRCRVWIDGRKHALLAIVAVPWVDRVCRIEVRRPGERSARIATEPEDGLPAQASSAAYVLFGSGAIR